MVGLLAVACGFTNVINLVIDNYAQQTLPVRRRPPGAFAGRRPPGASHRKPLSERRTSGIARRAPCVGGTRRSSEWGPRPPQIARDDPIVPAAVMLYHILRVFSWNRNM